VADDNPPPGEEIDPKLVSLFERFADAMEGGRIGEADELSHEAMAIVIEQAQNLPPSPAMLRSLLVDKAENDGQWQVAARFYEEDFAQAQGDANPVSRALETSRARLKLAAVRRQQGQTDAAVELARESVSLARQVDLEVYLATAIEAFAGILLHAGRPFEAITAIDEGLAALGERPLFALLRAQLWFRRAAAALAAGDAIVAQANLTEGQRSLTPFNGSQLAGAQATLAMSLPVQAKLTAAAGDWPSARAVWQQAVEIRRQLAEDWDHNWRSTENVAATISGFAQAAEAAGESNLAQSLRAQREQLVRDRAAGSP
jgi:tetratricopeptide (TPR) repeat protein